MFKKLAMLMIVVCLTTAHASDSLYRYEGGVRQYYPVDTTRILVKWKPFTGFFIQTGYLAPYPNISADTIAPNAADQYYMHFFTGAYNFNAIVNQLEADNNVVAVNKSLVTPDGKSMYYGDQIVCRFNPDVTIAYVDSLCQANHVTKLESSPYAPNQFILATTPLSPLGTLDMANYLWELPTTLWSHPNCRGNGSFFGYSVLDTFFHSSQWTTMKTLGYKSTANYGAWELTRGSSSIRVAVLDQGMEPHEDFDTSLWDQGIDFSTTDGLDLNFSPVTPEPDNIIEGHGMAVLGIIAARHNNPVPIGHEQGSFGYQSVAGGAPSVRIIPLRISNDQLLFAPETQIERAIYYAAAAGADVISCSWGYSSPPDNVVDAVNSSALYGRDGKGCVIVAAAGNFAMNLVAYPASSPYAIAVGAVRANDDRWEYSSFGNALDVVAPSGPTCISNGPGGGCEQDPTNYFYTVDRMDGWGYNPKEFGSCTPTQDEDYSCTFGGTSGAAPNVTSEVALLLSIDPTLNRAQVVDIVRKSAMKIDTNPFVTGLQVDTLRYGQGRANAVRALSTVRRGDCNASGSINVVDVTHLVAFLFQNGQEPFPDKYFGDASCDGNVNVVDVVKLTGYLFRGGPAPQSPCTAFQLDYE